MAATTDRPVLADPKSLSAGAMTRREGGEVSFSGRTIAIATSRNFTVRYILYSDILSDLLAAGVRVILLLRDGDLDHYRQKFAGRDVILEPVLFDDSMRSLKKNRAGRIFSMVRNVMSGESHALANSTSAIRRTQHLDTPAGGLGARFERLLAGTLAAAGNRLRLVRRLLVRLESFWLPGRQYDHYFKKYRPDLLITSSVGFGIDPFVMRSARRHGCPTLAIIHSWDNPSSKGYRGADPDYVITWNPAMKDEVEHFHDIPRERIAIGGVAHWDMYFDGRLQGVLRSGEEFRRHHGIPHEARVLFYGMGHAKNFRNSFDVIEGLLDRMAKGELAEQCCLLARLHPGYLLRKRAYDRSPTRDSSRTGSNLEAGGTLVLEEYRERMRQLEERYPGMVVFNVPQMQILSDDLDMTMEEMQDLAEMLSRSDVILNEYSTLMLEGAVFAKPVINIGLFHFRDTKLPAKHFESFQHIRRILDTEAFDNVYTFKELTDAINSALADPQRRQEGRRRLVDRELAWNRGTAGKSIAREILSLLERH